MMLPLFQCIKLRGYKNCANISIDVRWRRFCLNWPVLIEEWQYLSNATPTDDVHEGGISPLKVFEKNYSLLFECLYAVLEPTMSNS